MASSSAPVKEETAEEIEARKRMILSGQEGGNLSRITPGGEVMMNPDGSNGFTYMGGGGAASDGSNNYKWNEKTGDYRSHGGGIMKLGAMPKQASGGGGKKPKKKKKPNPGEDIVYGPRPGGVEYGPGPGTDDVVDNSGMNWWTNNGPITPGQSTNPLVDPNGWQYQADPNDGYIHDLGRYVAPGLLIPKKKGALV